MHFEIWSQIAIRKLFEVSWLAIQIAQFLTETLSSHQRIKLYFEFIPFIL